MMIFGSSLPGEAPPITGATLLFNHDIWNTGGITIVNTDKISNFNSLPSSAAAATQGTDGNRPVNDTSTTIAGLASIKYDRLSGSTGRHFAVNCSAATISAWTFYSLCRPYATPTNFDAVAGASGSPATGFLTLYTSTSANLATWVQGVGLLHSTGANSFVSGTTYRVCWTYDGSTVKIFIDNFVTAAASTASASRTGWGPSATVGLASGFAGIKINCGQQILYNTAHDQDQRNQMKTYLTRWG